MKAVFVALLHNLEIAENLGPGDKINETLRITNDHTVIGALLRPEHRKLMGEMEINSLLTGAPVALAETKVPEGMTPQQYLLARLYEVQAFLMTTWIFQDNAINCELGFVLYADGAVSTATSNFVAHLYSTARGEKPVTKLSREQLRDIRALHREAMIAPDHPFALPISQLTSAQSRISRALYVVNAARGERDIALRVAHYCTALETLFATSQTELAHQLSERVACYLCARSDDRLQMYRRVKAAYALRSKIVHGSTIRDSTVDDALELSEYCDGIARTLYQNLLRQPETRALFSQKADTFDEEMLKIVFTGSG